MERKKKVLIAAIVVLVAGAALSAAGFFAVIESDNHSRYFSLGEDLEYWQHVEELGHKLVIVGLPIAVVGLVMLLFGAFPPNLDSHTADYRGRSYEGLPPNQQKSPMSEEVGQMKQKLPPAPPPGYGGFR